MPPKPKRGLQIPKAKKLALSEFPNLGKQSSSSNPKQVGKTAKDVLQKEQSYFHKEHLEHVLTPSPEDSQWQNDAWFLKEGYLANQNYMVQDEKFRYLNEAMLTETGSVQIEHYNIKLTDVKT